MIDAVDQIIIDRLRLNCRTSFQVLSSLTGISANEVMKRIDRMTSNGIIEKFVVILSPQMSGEDTVIAILNFSAEPNENRLLKFLGENPSVHRVSRLLDGRYIVYGIYFEQDELTSLTEHLKHLPSIRNIELNFRFLHYWGGKIELTSSHRKILRFLLDDPRMAVASIAKKAGLESDNVKWIIEQMWKSEAVLFTIKTSEDFNKKNIEVLAKVQWNVGKTSKEEVLAWLQEQFGSLRLGECVSATEPKMFFHFSVNHVHEVELFANKIEEFGLVTTIEPMILFPATYLQDPRQRRARALLQETGFSSQNESFS